MEYLTVKEVAELKGCSERYVQKLVKEGNIASQTQLNLYNQQPCYMIPVSALPEQLQQKWYKRQRTEAGLLPELKEEQQKASVSRAKTSQRTFEELSDAERREVNLWTEIVQEWQGLRSGYKSKTEFDKLYVGKCQLEHPEVKISVSILYRKWNAYRRGDMEGLLDKRGAWNRGSSTIPTPVWDAFLWYWLDESRPTVSLCYRNVISWTEEFCPELVAEIPQERNFRRRIETC